MPKLLFTWEYGADLGHVSNFLPIAKHIAVQGWNVEFVIPSRVRGYERAKQLVEQNSFPCFDAPGSAVGEEVRTAINGHAQMLETLIGLRSTQEVSFFIRAWTQLLEQHRPDIVVGDYSVLSLIAARDLGIPTVSLDQGWFVPELNDDAPSVNFNQLFQSLRRSDRRFYDESQASEIAQSEQRVLTRVNRALGNGKLDVIDTFNDVYRSDLILRTNFAELSPIPHRDSSVFVGQLAPQSKAPVVEWPNSSIERAKVFVYLKAGSPVLEHIIEVLKESDYSVVCFISGVSSAYATAQSTDSFRMLSSAVNVPYLLEAANLVISNAGAGLTAQALLAGVPLVTVPLWTEQRLNANRIFDLYAGEIIDYQYSKSEVCAVIEKVLGNQVYLARARAFKISHHYADEADIARKILDVYRPNAMEEASSSRFARLDQFEWYWLYPEGEFDHTAFEKAAQRQPLLIPFAYASLSDAVNSLAEQCEDERFVTLLSGYELEQHAVVAGCECPAHIRSSHWLWNTLVSNSGLTMPSSAMICWSRPQLTAFPLDEFDAEHFYSRTDCSCFSSVLTRTSVELDALGYFSQGYEQSRLLCVKLEHDISFILSSPRATLVRRLFIHMSSGQLDDLSSYQLFGARLYFVDRFIRFKNPSNAANKSDMNALLEDGLAYCRRVQGDNVSNMSMANKVLGNKISDLVAFPPLIDMNYAESEQFAKEIIASKTLRHHLFEEYNWVAEV